MAQVGSGRVSHLWFGFELGKFPLKMSNFSIFFPSDQKNLFRSGQKVLRSRVGRPLIYCGSKVSLGQGPSLENTDGQKILNLKHFQTHSFPNEKLAHHFPKNYMIGIFFQKNASNEEYWNGIFCVFENYTCKPCFFIYFCHKIPHFANSLILFQYCTKYSHFSVGVAIQRLT